MIELILGFCGKFVMTSNRQDREERRKGAETPAALWSKLSLAQKFSANSLSRFGYKLDFIRGEQGKSIAVLRCHTGLAVITEDGDINITPDIKVRK